MCFCVLLYFTACVLYYCNTVGWAWWDWGLIWWLTILLQCFDTVGWVTWPVKISSPNDLYCVEWDVKPYSAQLTRLHFKGLTGQKVQRVCLQSSRIDWIHFLGSWCKRRFSFIRFSFVISRFFKTIIEVIVLFACTYRCRGYMWNTIISK